MKYKPYEYEKVTKLWTPLISFLVLTVILLLANFNRLSYMLGGNYYEKQSGVVLEHNTDNLFFVIPMVKIQWSYKDKTYEIERLDFTNVENGRSIDIAVNTKAPNHCILLNNNKLFLFNVIAVLLWVLTLVFLIRHLRLRYYQRKWIKYYPEFVSAVSKVDILKGDLD